jgi:hypothetical protein
MPGRTAALAAELRKDELLADDDPVLRDGTGPVKFESRLDTLCIVSAIEDWMEGGDLGMLAGPPGYEYACTAKPGPGALVSSLQSWILDWMS